MSNLWNCTWSLRNSACLIFLSASHSSSVSYSDDDDFVSPSSISRQAFSYEKIRRRFLQFIHWNISNHNDTLYGAQQLSYKNILTCYPANTLVVNMHTKESITHRLCLFSKLVKLQTTYHIKLIPALVVTAADSSWLLSFICFDFASVTIWRDLFLFLTLLFLLQAISDWW